MPWLAGCWPVIPGCRPSKRPTKTTICGPIPAACPVADGRRRPALPRNRRCESRDDRHVWNDTEGGLPLANIENEQDGLQWQVGVWDRISPIYFREVDRRFTGVVDGV